MDLKIYIVSIYVKPPLNKARKEIFMPFTWKKRNEEKKKILRQSHVKFDSKRGLKKTTRRQWHFRRVDFSLLFFYADFLAIDKMRLTE